jgi:hypothetical protein
MFTDNLKSTHGPQVKNGWSTRNTQDSSSIVWNGLHGPEKQNEAGLMVLSEMGQGKTSLQQNK